LIGQSAPGAFEIPHAPGGFVPLLLDPIGVLLSKMVLGLGLAVRGERVDLLERRVTDARPRVADARGV
jgi:hypothetical protein